MEENKQNGTIYVTADEEIAEIIDHIRNASERTVTLIVPKEAALFQDITNLKILQKKAEQMGKEISISKAGEGESFRRVAGSSMIIRNTPSKAAPKSHLAEGGTKRISDMVQKKETVDLRQIDLSKRNDEIKKEETEEADSPLQPRHYESLRDYAKEAEKFPEEKQEQIYKKEENKERDEIFWGDLEKDKIASNEEKEEEIEGLFDGHRRITAPQQEEDYDFNDSLQGKKRKKRTLLPTISARFFASFILICVLTASLCLFFILPKAEIAIALKTEEIGGDFTFTANEKIFDIDEKSREIPAAKSNISSEKKQSFATTSKKRVTEKAAGEITILNECSTGAQVLVAGTRFLSKADGKIFKIEEAATVPGFTKPEADVVPGQKRVKVIAAEAGEAYNISATTFTIPAYQEKGDWRYSCLYAKSDKAMAGGSDKEVAYVSQEDYDKAKATLTSLLKEENKAKIEGQKDEKLIFLNNTSDEGTITETSSAKVGDIAESFEMSATINKPVLSITKEDLESLLRKKIEKLNTFENAKAQEESLSYTLGDIVEKDKVIQISVEAKENFAFELNKDTIREEISGKNKEELNAYFSKMSGIKSVSVNFWPFWVKSVPENQGKIDITLDIGESI